MNRIEFLKELRTALENDLSGPIIRENIDYYDQYIRQEAAGGKTEEEVISMLGDPWILARTIIDTAGEGNGKTVYEERTYSNRASQSRSGETYVQGGDRFGVDVIRIPWWKKLLAALLIVGVIVLIVSVVAGLLGLVIKFMLPILLVCFIISFLTSRWK